MTKSTTPRIGRGWSISNSLPKLEKLLIRSFDSNKGRFFWQFLDDREPSRANLAPHPQPLASNPVFIPNGLNLIYTSVDGISAYSFQNEQAALIFPMDMDLHTVDGLSVSPDASTLYFVRTKWNKPLSNAITEVGLGGGRVRIAPIAIDVITLEIHSGTINCNPIPGLPVSLSFPPSSSEVYVLTHDGRLSHINLGNSHMTELARLSPNSRINVSRDDSLLAWQLDDSGFNRVSKRGTSTVSPFGWFPSEPPDGSKIGFTRGSNEFWLKDGARDSELVLALPKSDSLRYDTPTWSPSGKNIAVNLMGGPHPDKTFSLTLIDTVSRTITMVPHDEISLVGGRIWIPTDVTL
jgi:hypothetical protein